jgi:polysaccharide deacetylase family protein (PEP-CTERM system associated)
MMKIITFDIEEWYLEKKYFGDHQENYNKFDSYLDQILDKLDERNFKGTFFCVGGMAAEFPQVVKKIEGRGHEIGCHSYKHVWLNQMSEEEVYEDTRTSVDAIEQCIGKKVKSYRAPAFSIGKDNKWAFEILSKCGIERDSSVFPAERDFGGFSQFGQKAPTMASYKNTKIKEFPISVTAFLGKELGYSGGGYFRFFPLDFVKKEMAKSDYTMTYFHIADLIPESSGLMSKEDFEAYFKIPGTLKNRCMRYVKSNLGKKNAFGKLLKLIDTEDFVNLEQADQMINWDEAPSVVL